MHADAAGRRPPGPRGRLVFGSLRDLRRDPLGLLTSARAEYGDVIRFRYLGRRSWYFFAHPAHLEEILITRYHDFPKGVFGRVIDVLIPRGLVTTDGAGWANQRKLLQPGFAPARLDRLVGTIVHIAHEHLDALAERAARGQALDVSRAMLRLAFVVAGRTLFGSDLDASNAAMERYVRMGLAQIDARVLHPLSPLPYLPTPRRLGYLAATRRADKAVSAIIAKRRLDPGCSGGADLVSMLLEARDAETGRTLDDGQVRDQVKTVMISGYETTGLSLGWVLYNLARHPAVAARVRSEVRSVFGDGPPVLAGLRSLTYTRQVLDESLRLYPPTGWLGRQAARTCQIGGYTLPQGALVCVSPFVTHRHPRFWKTPERFDPDNFSAERASERPRGAYLPFGLGPRYCIGHHLGMTEMLIVLSMALSRWDFTLAPGPEIRPVVRGTLHPSSPVRLYAIPAPAGAAPRAAAAG